MVMFSTILKLWMVVRPLLLYLSATSLGGQGRVPLGLTMLIASAPSAGVGGTDDPHFRTLVSRTPELRVWPVYTIPRLSSITDVEYSSREK